MFSSSRPVVDYVGSLPGEGGGMDWLDIVILVVVGFSAVAGLGLGGIQIGVTGAGVLAGIVLSGYLHERVRPIASWFTDNDNAAEVVAFVVIFLAVLILSVFLGFVVRSVLRRLTLSWPDRLLGLGLAVVVILAAGSAFFSTIQSHPVAGLEHTIDESTLGSFLADQFDTVLRGVRLIPRDLGV